MKARWDGTMGRRQAMVVLEKDGVVLSSNCGPGGSDAGTIIPHQDFLDGKYQSVILQVFGQDALDEMISAVTDMVSTQMLRVG